ncbi:MULTISPECIES: ATP/GTP-binding protein [unclassified Leucobacter]|uniref:ATP/GTP-binding protein n=1 Tax=unclassified Leucobacter TaxID=2621730 RepID=UPI00165E92C5|nr:MULTISPECIES: ATP/GTP-binding protein [unclassified Leucobacter]MBC9928051.1 ATP/GTP-binding protein [Leucobacter sp. cx-169]
MARKHRRAEAGPLSDVGRLANGGAQRVTRRGSEWFVREISSSRAEKAYRCPGCGQEVPVGQAHLVVWSAEHFFGDEAAVRDRRHWHLHCWRLA